MTLGYLTYFSWFVNMCVGEEYTSWRDSAYLTSRDLAKRIKSQQAYALFPSKHGCTKKKVDFSLLRLSPLWNQLGYGLALFYRPHPGWLRNRDKVYTWLFRGFQVLPRNCFSWIILNSVLCEALGDRISGDSSGINFIANSSDSTCLKLGNKVSCIAILYHSRVHLFGWQPTDFEHSSNEPILFDF